MKRNLVVTHKRSVSDLLNRWNEATAPYKPRTEHEHLRCNQLARAIRNEMKRMGLRENRDYRELSNGSLWPIRH